MQDFHWCHRAAAPRTPEGGRSPASSLDKKPAPLVPAPRARAVTIAVNTSPPGTRGSLAICIRYLPEGLTNETATADGAANVAAIADREWVHGGPLAPDGYKKLQPVRLGRRSHRQTFAEVPHQFEARSHSIGSRSTTRAPRAGTSGWVLTHAAVRVTLLGGLAWILARVAFPGTVGLLAGAVRRGRREAVGPLVGSVVATAIWCRDALVVLGAIDGHWLGPLGSGVLVVSVADAYPVPPREAQPGPPA